MDIKEIQQQFNRVIEWSQDIPNPDTNDLFARWLESKRDFIEAMDGKLIWEFPEPVSFELGTKEKSLRIDDFINMVDNRWRNGSLADFIETQRDGFFSNQVVTPYRIPGVNGVEIPKGMKLLKAFKYFEDDTKALNDMQSAASMIIQEDKVSGTLCLSVHPLDFLSTSENNHNWRSCHALDGEYRSGNLSYMVDKSTIICYLKSKNDEVLPNFPEDIKWNSKKWRVLLYLSDDWNMLFAGRQYPFTTDSGLNFVKDKVLPQVHMGEWTNWCSSKIKSIREDGVEHWFKSPYVPVADTLIQMKDLITNVEGSLQFNDLLSSSCYDPLYAYKQENSTWGGLWRPETRYTRFKIGGHVRCLRCGCGDIEVSETFMCNPCELEFGDVDNDYFSTCPCCGHRYIYDEGYWVAGADETVCPDCAESETDYCSRCGDRFYTNDLVYNRKDESLICHWCAEELENG